MNGGQEDFSARAWDDLRRATRVLGLSEADLERITDEVRRESQVPPAKDAQWVLDQTKRRLAHRFCTR